MKEQKACGLNVKVIYALKLSYSMVNIQIFRLGEIRSHIIENISFKTTLDLNPGQICEDILKPIDKSRG